MHCTLLKNPEQCQSSLLCNVVCEGNCGPPLRLLHLYDKSDIISLILYTLSEEGEKAVHTIHNAVRTEQRPKKKPKKLIKIAFSKRTTIIILLVLQFAFILLTFTTLSSLSAYVRIVFSWLAIFLAFVIINTNENPAYKLAWIVPLIAMPVFASVLYLMLNNQYSSRRLKAKYAKKLKETKKYLRTDPVLLHKIRRENRDFEKLVRYIQTSGGYPAYTNSSATYLPFGETKFAVMMQELKKAKKFIFMEYFIIDDGKMWQAIVDILLEKVEQGVEVLHQKAHVLERAEQQQVHELLSRDAEREEVLADRFVRLEPAVEDIVIPEVPDALRQLIVGMDDLLRDAVRRQDLRLLGEWHRHDRGQLHPPEFSDNTERMRCSPSP